MGWTVLVNGSNQGLVSGLYKGFIPMKYSFISLAPIWLNTIKMIRLYLYLIGSEFTVK